MTLPSAVWHLTLLSIHAAALAAVWTLYRQAPDRMQKLVLAVLGMSFVFLIGAYALEVAGFWWHWMVARMAYEVEHLAVLAYVLRLFVTDQERRCLPNFSAHSRAQ